MIYVTAQTEKFNAIKFVQAMRRATGIGLRDGLDQVRRLSEGEPLQIDPAGVTTDQELASWLESCGVVFEQRRTEQDDGDG